MKSLAKVKEVQALNGRSAALTQFISKSTNNYASLFNLLENNNTFEWMNECEETFKKLKDYLATPSILT